MDELFVSQPSSGEEALDIVDNVVKNEIKNEMK